VSDQILDVDLLAFETGSKSQRAAVVDGVMRSLRTGFVFTAHDLSDAMLDETYALLADFFALEAEQKQSVVVAGSHGQVGYTGLLVETAASSDVPDFKEMLNWSAELPEGHPLRRRYPHHYNSPVFGDEYVPGMSKVLTDFHERVLAVQRRFLRIIAVGLGAHEEFFDDLTADGPTLTRAIRYPSMADAPSGEHVWAGAHGDINLITALPRATARGLQVLTDDGWVDATPPDGQVIINTGIMLERVSNGILPTGIHRVVADPDQSGDRLSVVQFCHPASWMHLSPLASCITEQTPQRFGTIEAADALDQVIYEINLVEDARRV
jgi:isopenicillin N synthase-like dioxygenase